MTIEIKLLIDQPDNGEGFPIVVRVSHRGKRKQKLVAHSKVNHFNEQMQLVNEKHPDYDELLSRLMEIKLKSRKIIALGCEDVDQALQQLFENKAKSEHASFNEWCQGYIDELKSSAGRAEKKGDVQDRNRIMGNVRANQTALNVFSLYYTSINFEQLEYNTMMRFRKFREIEGNSKATIQNYLRQLRAMYNRGIRELRLPDNRPFEKLFEGLKVKSFDMKKKYLTIEDIRAIEKFKPKSVQSEKYKDLFLLQFYFGGCDLTDIYFLEANRVRNGRVILERGKTGQMVNLKIHPKAQEIIDKHKALKGTYLFPWDKDITKYETFRRRLQRYLIDFQNQLQIKVLPIDGNIGIKVARHTFGNRAKQLMIDADIIRELMGHERDDVDNFYKDKFSEKVRDEVLFRIIDTENV